MALTYRQHSSSKNMHALPLPMSAAAWPRGLREAAGNLWRFHLALLQPQQIDRAGSFFAEEAAHAEAAEPLRIVPQSVFTGAYAACRRHKLPLARLAEQIRAAASFSQPIRFDTALEMDRFVCQWAGSHAQLLAALAGQRGAWQEKGVQELARGFYLTGRLCYMQQDLMRDHIFLPLEDLRQTNVTIKQLHDGTMDKALRRLLWKQTIRIRDAYANAFGLGKDLFGWQRRAFRLYWLGGLYLLAEIEKREYDLWSQPFGFSMPRRLQLRWQVLRGKISFR